MDWATILALLHDAGAASGPIFGLLWWLERRERLDDRRQSEINAEKRDDALTEVRLALNTISAIFNNRPQT